MTAITERTPEEEILHLRNACVQLQARIWELEREAGALGDLTITVNIGIWRAMRCYLRELHKQGAVDEFKMQNGGGYLPLAECLKLWEIGEPPDCHK